MLKEVEILIDQIRGEIKNSKFLEYDIRYDYYIYLVDILSVFKRGIIISNQLESTAPNEVASHRNSLNRSLVIDSWCLFEFCITRISESVLTNEEQNDLKEGKIKEVLKLVSENNLTDSSKDKLNKLLVEKYLARVSTSRKCDKLFKICVCYKRDIKNDKAFLHFISTLRNTMHGIFIFYGSDFEYEFFDITTHFKNDAYVQHSAPPGFQFHLKLSIELMNVFSQIIESIEYSEKIKYPIMQDS